MLSSTAFINIMQHTKYAAAQAATCVWSRALAILNWKIW